jgi:hypothetical protein
MRNQFDNKTAGKRTFNNGILLESIEGSCIGKVIGFGFMGHCLEIIEAGDKSSRVVGTTAWTGQNWRLNWRAKR